MPDVLKKLFGSRKFWSFAVGLVTLIGASLEDGAFSAQEVQAISALVIGYIASIAYEDSAHARAAGEVNAAAMQASQPTQPTVGIDANNVTVSPPPSPTLGRMG